MKPPMLYRARLPAALLLAAMSAFAADAPGEAEWAPVAQALGAGGDQAVAAVEAITTAYPKWPDGHRALASARLRAGDPSGAWKAARVALGINKNDTAAAALGIQALAGVGRYDDAYKVALLFTDDTDTGGAVASQAAITALMARNDETLASFLALAKTRAQGPAPVLDFIAAKQAQMAKDLPAAVTALNRAIAAKPDYRDALYELGRALTVQAMQTPKQADELLGKADEAFAAAAKTDVKDADSRLGLGRARLEHGKILLAAGKADEGSAMLRQALTALDEGLQLDPSNRDGKLWKGDALLRLERWEEAAPMLKQAFAAGATDRALPFNMSLALARSGHTDEAAKVLENVEAHTDGERMTLAMNAFDQGNWAAAKSMLEHILQGQRDTTALSPQQWWSSVRYLAHCNRELAALTQGERREHLLAEAIGMYKQAGDNDDYVSRHWYMHLQVPLGPKQAFEAGRQSLTWNGFWNPSAWKLLAANYGWKVSQGEGLGGAVKHGPAHVMLWTLLTIIPIGLFLKGWLLPNGLYGGGGKAKPSVKPGTRSAAKPGAAKPGAAGARRHGAPPPRKPVPGAKPPSRALAPKDGSGPKTPFSE